MQILVHSSDLVVVVQRFSFRALLVSQGGSPGVDLICDPFTAAIITAISFHHGKRGFAAGLALMPAVAPEA